MKALTATLCDLSCVVTIVAQPVIFFGEDTNTTSTSGDNPKYMRSGGTQTNLPIPSTVHTAQQSGSVLFFGVIDRSMPFTSLIFSDTLGAADGFGLDNMTIEQAPPDLQIWTAVELGVATQTGRLYQLQWTPKPPPIAQF